jgi:predicted DNA-binding transcriptional regulator AlpA
LASLLVQPGGERGKRGETPPRCSRCVTVIAASVLEDPHFRPAAVAQFMPNKILRKPSVLERTGWSAPTLWRRVKDGSFPPPRRIGPRAVGWLESEVDDAIAAFPVADHDRPQPWRS